MFFFWILIYIEKEEKMKISCNRVSKYFEDVIFVGVVNLGYTYLHGYLIRYIFYDNKRFNKDKRKGTWQCKVLFNTL